MNIETILEKSKQYKFSEEEIRLTEEKRQEFIKDFH